MRRRIRFREIMKNLGYAIIDFFAWMVYNISNVFEFFSTIYFARKQRQRYRDFVCGIRVGEKRFIDLSMKLLDDMRYTELKIAAQDSEYRAELYMKYNIR